MFPKGIHNLHNRLIISKAREMGISCEPLLAGCEDFLELSAMGKRIVINKTRSHRLPLIAGLLAKNKQVCNQLLQQQGMPVPSFIVISEMGRDAEQFLALHRSVVVKPLDASGSVGVTIDVRTSEELAAAVHRAGVHSESIMLQQFVTGADYRILVINGEVAAVTEYRPAFVEGDDSTSIRELIQQLNAVRIKNSNIGEFVAFPEIEEDSDRLRQVLDRQGVRLEDVPESGRRVQLYDLHNAEAGTISELYADCTEAISPANAEMAVQAARALQIDVAGIDIRCEDIGKPLTRAQGGILEVNALPDMTFHVFPFQGPSRDVIRLYLEYLFQEEYVTEMQATR